jgi:hypothetical protein
MSIGNSILQEWNIQEIISKGNKMIVWIIHGLVTVNCVNLRSMNHKTITIPLKSKT